ncbi:hypothetical protein ACWCWQ_07615 [Streptomyces sp. NPDC001571]
MRALPSPDYSNHHWLVISAMISGSPNRYLVWTCLIALGTAFSLWRKH